MSSPETLTKDVAAVELVPSVEQPKHVVNVVLPPVVGNIRLGIHTDTTIILLKTLRVLGKDIKVQGRILNPEQEKQLVAHPVYKFFMQGRLARVREENQADVLTFAIPKDLDFSEDEVAQLSSLAFSPATLRGAIGYDVGFFDALQMVAKWEETHNPNEFLPKIGGSNEFLIGSDTLTEDELAEAAEAIKSRLCEADTAVLPSFTHRNLSPFNLYSVNSLNSGKSFIKENIVKKIINYKVELPQTETYPTPTSMPSSYLDILRDRDDLDGKGKSGEYRDERGDRYDSWGIRVAADYPLKEFFPPLEERWPFSSVYKEDIRADMGGKLRKRYDPMTDSDRWMPDDVEFPFRAQIDDLIQSARERRRDESRRIEELTFQIKSVNTFDLETLREIYRRKV